MNAIELVGELSRLGVKLFALGDRLHVDAPGGVITPVLRQGLAQYKPQIMALLGGDIPPVFPEGGDDSFEQQPPRPVPTPRAAAMNYRQGVSIWAGAPTPIQSVVSAVQRERPDLGSYTAPDGTVTIFFTDIEGSSEMTDRLGDRRWMVMLRDHNAIIREQVVAPKGFEVKSQGDGFMVAFPSARSALQCAIGIQRSLAAHNEQPDGEAVLVRIGVHSGEPIKEGNDLFGRDVILAARISEEARGGQILASPMVKELTDSNGEFSFDQGREVEMKGLSGQHMVFEVEWQDEDSHHKGTKETPNLGELSRNGQPREVDRSEEDGRSPTGDLGRSGLSTTVPDFLDVNLVGNLVRWAFQAKRRMGHERLMDLLELYLRSGRCSLELTEIIGHICSMVDEGPDYEADPAQESVDLMHQLHGILAGGVPIAHRPASKFGDGEPSG